MDVDINIVGCEVGGTTDGEHFEAVICVDDSVLTLKGNRTEMTELVNAITGLLE